LQVIVFNFSKKECEALALQMQSLDLNDDAERTLVDGIFANAVRLWHPPPCGVTLFACSIRVVDEQLIGRESLRRKHLGDGGEVI